MLRNVAVVFVTGFLPFEFGPVCGVFGVDRSDDGLPRYDFAVVAGEPPPLRALDFTMHPSHGLERLEQADLIALPAVSDARLSLAGDPGAGDPGACAPARRFPEDLLEAPPRPPHWRNATELARRYPRAKVDPDVLYVDDDPVITSAGTAAGIDACLYLVRKEQGSRGANGIARRMVDPPHRDGGQAQYVVQPIAPSCDGSLRDLLEWLRAHLDQPLAVRPPAARGNMSERTFARRFVQDTGTTPQRWLTGQRILLAQQLLEETVQTGDASAARTGFSNATARRHRFRLWRGTTPNAYRRLFRGDPSPSAPAPR